jgi:regulator of sigma E protease
MATPLIFLAILSVLVLVHELGHFLTAKYFGIRVDEFALGLPFTKPIFQTKRGETLYSIYPLFFGGFVRMHGEETEVKEEKDRSFWARSKTQRMAVILAGVVMNIALALVAFVALYLIVGVPIRTVEKVTIVGVEPGSPAEVAGLMVEDRVVAVEDKPVTSGEEFGMLMRSWAGLPVNLTIERGAGVPLFEGIAQREVVRQVLSITPRKDHPADQGPLGVGIAQYPYLETQKCVNIGCVAQAAYYGGVKVTGQWIGRIATSLRDIGANLTRGQVPQDVAGPIGIYQLTGVVSQGGFLPLLELTAILSVNLAVFNILPIPALDGGRAFFIWLEALRRKRIPAEVEQKINAIGMMLLLALIALITLQDVLRLGVLSRFLPK